MENVLRGLFTGAEDEALAARHKSESQKQQDISMWQNVLHGGPDIDDEHRMRAADELAKLHGLKKGENPYKRVATVLNTLKAGIQGKVQPAAVQGAGVEGAAEAARQVDPQDEATQQSTQRIEQKTQSLGGKILSKVGKGLSTGLHHLNAGLDKMQQVHEQRELHKLEMPTQAAYDAQEKAMQKDIAQAQKEQGVSPDSEEGRKIAMQVRKLTPKPHYFPAVTEPDSESPTGYSKVVKDQDGNTVLREPTTAPGYNRPVYGPAISVRNARQLAQQGTEFVGQDGKPIDVNSLPDEMGLKQFTLSGKTVYVPFSPNQRVVTVGNESYAISPMDVGSLTDGAGTDLGQKNVGSTRLPGYTGIDAAGNIQRVAGQTTPGTTGVKRTLPSLDPKYDSVVNPKAKGGAKSGGTKQQTSPQGKGKGSLPLPASMYGKQADRATGVRLAQAALYQFRDSDLDVYDNPESVEKLKNIIGLIQKTADQQLKTGQGPMGTLETWAGLPSTLNRLQQDLVQEQAIQLNPKEQQFLADYFYLLGSWPGMRRSVGTSPARWSMNLMFSELPTPGLVNSSREAAARLQNMDKETKQVELPNQLRGLADEGGSDSTTPKRPKNVPTNAVWNPGKRQWQMPTTQ